VLLKAFLPRIGIENLIAREIELLAFEPGRGKIENHVAAEIGLDLAVFLHGDQCLVGDFAVERREDIDVVIAVNGVVFFIEGFHRTVESEHLRQRRQALLSIEDQLFRVGNRAAKCEVFNRPHLKANIAAGLQEHDRAHRKGARNADQQRTHVAVIPNPAPLKIRKLYPTEHDVLDNVWQRYFCTIKATHAIFSPKKYAALRSNPWGHPSAANGPTSLLSPSHTMSHPACIAEVKVARFDADSRAERLITPTSDAARVPRASAAAQSSSCSAPSTR
jgi:hypothetical protein